MKEIKVRVEDDLAEAVKRAAQKANTSVNLWIKGLLEETLQGEQSFDYTEAFQKVLADVEQRADGEFTLSDLPSFSGLCVSTVEKGYLQPSTLRARVGKAFNLAVRQGQVPGVTRAKDKRGDLKFRFRAAVYRKETRE